MSVPDIEASIRWWKDVLDFDLEFVGHFEHGDNIFIRDNAGNLIEFVQEPDMWK